MNHGKAIISAATLVFLAMGGHASVAAAQTTCSIQDVKIVCADNIRDGSAVLDAMANPASRDYFEGLIKDPAFSLDTNKRETYRRSLEANRRSMRLYANRQLRKLRRRQIDLETYETVRQRFNEGMKTYRSALNIYRSTIWLDPTAPVEEN